MKKIVTKWGCLLLFLIAAFSTKAQNILPPAFEIKTDTLTFDTLYKQYYQVLEDKEAKWTIEQVTAVPLSNNFHYPNNKGGGIDSTVNTYWFRYTLKNVMHREAAISLNSMCDYDEFYVFDSSGKRQYFASGKLQQWDKKNGLKKADCIPYPLQPGQTIVVYQRTSNKKPGLPDIFIISVVGTNKAIAQAYVDPVDEAQYPDAIFAFRHITEAFIIGFLLFTAIFNLFYFSIVKEKVYLYFTLFLFFLSINRCYNIYSAYYWVMDKSMVKYNAFIPLAWVFIQFFLVQFIRHFFKTYRSFKKWDVFLNSLSIVVALLMILQFLQPGNAGLKRVVEELNMYALDLVFISLLISLLLFIPQAKKDKFIKLMILGAFPFICFYTANGIVGIVSYLFKNPEFIAGTKNWIEQNFRPVEIVCMGWFVIFSSRILFLRYSQLQKENVQQALDKERLTREKEQERTLLIEQQKILLEKQVEERTSELKNSLENLKAAQSQLIQSEKMASLGELTAGIAHEIQNPLNFVNNFSEVSNELIDEMNAELNKGDIEEAKAISSDIKQNLEKINHHGKRADAIVKGMLEHSRSSNGAKEPTDINKLADEYLRLAYHGLRAKDKTFNATLKTDFDENLGNINIIPQDIGRVILNLITNAFYVVDEKKKAGAENYEPTVSVSTKKMAGKVLISVKDNGNGIPSKVLDKIFQPFFTTKPTGQGTGLGLSLSYDIIKAHGGELKVQTKEGEFAEFVITLPL